jgi:nitrous oxidase accessory protein
MLVLVVGGLPEAAQSQHADLQSMIDAARAGDTLLVASGNYEGNFILNKRLALIGEGMPVLRGIGQGSVVTILADSCTVRGFVIENSGSMLVDEDAGVLIQSSGNLVEQNDLREVLFGIYVFAGGRNRLVRNTIHGRPERSLGERGSGVHLWNSRSNRLAGNIITGVRDGIYIQNANDTWIEDCQVWDVRYGVHYMYADSNTFRRNSFRNNIAGAAIMYSRQICMSHNVFSDNRSFSSFGVLFQDCHGVVVDSNVIADNAVGMFLEASTDNLFRNNVIARNDLALQMFQNSIHNVFVGNNFIDNLSPLTIVGKTTGSIWSENGKGNYWSSYDGYDLDGDGVGDVPMKIQNVFQYLEGRNPNVRLFLYSPASQALSIAAKTFPVIAFNEELDRHPLMSSTSIESTSNTTVEGPNPAMSLSLIILLGSVSTGCVVLHRRLGKP